MGKGGGEGRRGGGGERFLHLFHQVPHKTAEFQLIRLCGSWGGSMQSMHDAPMQSETSRSCAPCSLNTRELFMITLSDSCCDNSLPISQQNLKHVCTVLHDMHEPHAVPQNPRTALRVVFNGCLLTASTLTLPQTLYLYLMPGRVWFLLSDRSHHYCSYHYVYKC